MLNCTEQADLIKTSRYFNEQWYLEQYPDVADLGIDPALHYLNYGAECGRNPGPDFDTKAYLKRYPAVAAAKINPLYHFEVSGGKEGSLPSDAPRLIKGNIPLVKEAPSILHCAHASGRLLFGGERSFVNVLDALAGSNVNIVVTLPSGVNREYIDAVCDRSSGVYIFPYQQWVNNRPADETVVGHFSEIIIKHDIQLIHANTIVLLEPLIAARRLKRIAVIHVHEIITQDEMMCTRLGLSAQNIILEIFRRSDYILVNSQATAAVYKKNERTFYVPNTIDIKELDLSNDLDSDKVKFAIISSNIPKKGVADFIEVAKLCRMRAPNAQFLIIGPENPQIIKWKEDLDQGLLPANLKFCGYRSTPREAMIETNVVLNLSSFAESFGRTVAEALASGRPVIAYEWGALPELIQHGISGYLAPYRDTRTVASFVEHFCRNPKLISGMGEHGRKFIGTNFTPDKLKQSLCRAYSAILGYTIPDRTAD
jgi:glycosyltransferase involved in cell wall biosynthesis